MAGFQVTLHGRIWVIAEARSSSLFFPFSQAASVATLPSALLCERFSLGASWVFSIH
jgi:hypothetical protein